MKEKQDVCFFYDPVNVGHLISGSSAFSKSTRAGWGSCPFSAGANGHIPEQGRQSSLCNDLPCSGAEGETCGMFFKSLSRPSPCLLQGEAFFPGITVWILMQFPGRHCVDSDAAASFGLWFPPIVHITRFGRQDSALRCFPVCACILSRVRLSVAPWTVTHQAPLSMGFPRQEQWSGWPFPPPGHLLGPGIQHGSMPGRFFTPEPAGKPLLVSYSCSNKLLDILTHIKKIYSLVVTGLGPRCWQDFICFYKILAFSSL